MRHVIAPTAAAICLSVLSGPAWADAMSALAGTRLSAPGVVLAATTLTPREGSDGGCSSSSTAMVATVSTVAEGWGPTCAATTTI